MGRAGRFGIFWKTNVVGLKNKIAKEKTWNTPLVRKWASDEDPSTNVHVEPLLLTFAHLTKPDFMTPSVSNMCTKYDHP